MENSQIQAIILDPCCGSRMFYFDKMDKRVLFGDIRDEAHLLCDGRELQIRPDERMDFRQLPFNDCTFKAVVFDPPHLKRAGEKSWIGKKYGILSDDWRNDLRSGFAECFRVLDTNGVMIFKWSEVQIPLSEIIALTPYKPVIGHRSGKQANTHWILFIKP